MNFLCPKKPKRACSTHHSGYTLSVKATVDTQTNPQGPKNSPRGSTTAKDRQLCGGQHLPQAGPLQPTTLHSPECLQPSGKLKGNTAVRLPTQYQCTPGMGHVAFRLNLRDAHPPGRREADVWSMLAHSSWEWSLKCSSSRQSGEGGHSACGTGHRRVPYTHKGPSYPDTATLRSPEIGWLQAAPTAMPLAQDKQSCSPSFMHHRRQVGKQCPARTQMPHTRSVVQVLWMLLTTLGPFSAHPHRTHPGYCLFKAEACGC